MGIFDNMALPGSDAAAPDFKSILDRGIAAGAGGTRNMGLGGVNDEARQSASVDGWSIQADGTGGYLMSRAVDDPRGDNIQYRVSADGKPLGEPEYYKSDRMLNFGDFLKYAGLFTGGMFGLNALTGGALGGTSAAAGGLPTATGGTAATGTASTAATAATTAGGMSLPEQIAFLSANVSDPATIASILGPEGAAAAGLTTTAAGSATLASTAQDIVKSVTAAGGDIVKTAMSLAGTPLGKALLTAAGLAAVKTASTADNNPMLDAGAGGLKDIGQDATARATSNDDEFRRLFLDRYMGMMDRADARDTELYDWNMGRARLAAGQMDKFYSAVDSFDSEANKRRMVGEAMATARQSDASQLSALSRGMGRAGLNPNSGVWMSNLRQAAQNAALNQSMAANMARTAAEKEGISLRASAAGLRGADASYAGQALSGAGLGMGAVQAGQTGWNANNANWNSTMGLGAQAFGSLGQFGLSRTNAADQVNIANTTGRNSLIGYGLGRLWGG